MPSITNLFNIAKSALLAHQQSMNVIGHNIANVNTEGYSKQRAVYSSAKPYYDANGIYGSGVQIEEVTRFRADYIDRKINEENSSQGKWDILKNGIDQVEQLFTGLGERDLSTNLSNFFNAWDTLSIDAQSMENRQALVDNAVLLVNQLNDMGSTLNGLYSDISQNIQADVDQINEYAAQIAELNGMIKSMELEAGLSDANDLRDKRQVLLNKLSRIVGLRYTEDADGMVSVTVSGKMLIAGNEHYEVSSSTSLNDYGTRTAIYLSSDNAELEVTDGELGGYIALRDEKIASYIDTLNSITEALVENVNREHSAGFDLNGETGIDFFDSDGVTTTTVGINQDILDDPAKIAASAGEDTDGDGVPDTVTVMGDTSVALRISNLRNLRIFDEDTIIDKVFSLYSSVGFDSQEASFNQESNSALLDQLTNAREAEVGVSIDEEMASLIQVQNSYAAAAKLMEAVNTLMDTVISMVG